MAEMSNTGGCGDENLNAWAARVIPRAVAYARTLLPRAADAEDVVHDVLCRLLGHSEYDLVKDGEKLLFRSVTNACINRITRAHRTASLDTAGAGDGSWIASLPARRTPDPAELAIAGELREAVRHGLAALPPRQRAALELKSIGHSLKEIAHMLDLSVSNAGVLVHRARTQLAEFLGSMNVPDRMRGGSAK